MSSEREELFWVVRAQAGDREAFDLLLRGVEGPLYRYVRRLVGEDATAEDVLQDVFVLIFRKVRWLREPELFRSWAYRIASREAFRRLRKERGQGQRVGEEVLEGVAAETEESEFPAEWRARVPQMLDEVTPASRAVLALHFLEEMPLDEVAAVLEIPLGTVKSRLAYGLARLRKRFGAGDVSVEGG